MRVLLRQHALTPQGTADSNTITRLPVPATGMQLLRGERVQLPGLRRQVLQLGHHLPLHAQLKYLCRAHKVSEEAVLRHGRT